MVSLNIHECHQTLPSLRGSVICPVSYIASLPCLCGMADIPINPVHIKLLSAAKPRQTFSLAETHKSSYGGRACMHHKICTDHAAAQNSYYNVACHQTSQTHFRHPSLLLASPAAEHKMYRSYSIAISKHLP